MTQNLPVLEVRNVAKRFGSVTALEDINLSIQQGEIVALLGDNGAGKSTLMNIMCGANQPDEGAVLINGQPIKSLRHAQEMGVGMVYQDLAMAPDLNVAENMFLGRELTIGERKSFPALLDRPRMNKLATEQIEKLGITTLRDVRTKVSSLSGGQRQVAAIARAMMWTKAAILLDEPTAALGPKQVGVVLDAIRSAAAQGLGVCIIAHDIPHILALADKLVILRRGRVALVTSTAGQTVSSVVTEMIGESV
ncbi:ATP-binding cassette domain-containing protein [Agrobacterium leguminum]|uniref:ATP-binding cassette domain-containing protein n=1 Tax=Agrobacterium TaxID=357 RepID=UPI0015736B4D|nr:MULTISPECIES: ATP-binding cassette domain-containing protein [Agrobacterium]MCZ7934869.1 ATP-binding cassette domain-containing protein [Agrobacterium leguminum]MCZ7977004.1 ATP-binding cassette domain-containing protein [Agrobacterium salinitolerans]NSX94162.1 sugar ABC transporter ATP-binding protein [Agrobacterium tumefaciens]NTA35506.1 sugar ABC transporter ATP-binding protein [Agrobacterium salinitolerans]